MHTSPRLVTFLTLLAFGAGLLCARDAAAGPSRARKEAAHEGWVLGLVFGTASSDVTVQNGSTALSSGWIGGGRVIRGRVGYFPRSNLLLVGEYGVWRRAEASTDSVSEDTSDAAGWTEATDRYLGGGVLSAHFYPMDTGFSLKAGLGYGRIIATVDQDGLTASQDQWGVMLVMGAGWEFSIAHDISIGLGADVGRIDGGSEVGVNFLHLTATFQLHLADGIPKNWF